MSYLYGDRLKLWQVTLGFVRDEDISGSLSRSSLIIRLHPSIVVFNVGKGEEERNKGTLSRSTSRDGQVLLVVFEIQL